jgi:hypothetical protein
MVQATWSTAFPSLHPTGEITIISIHAVNGVIYDSSLVGVTAAEAEGNIRFF